MRSIDCPQCGRRVNPAARFCEHCGASLQMPAARTQRTGDATAAPQTGRAAPARAEPPQSEREVWFGTYSAWGMFNAWLAAALISLTGGAMAAVASARFADYRPLLLAASGLLVMWGYLGLLLVYRRWSTLYRLTTQRFFHESGILRRVTNRIELIDVRDVTFAQGILERLVGVGTIQILSSDETHPRLVMPGIAEVQHVVQTLEATRREIQRRRLSYVERV